MELPPVGGRRITGFSPFPRVNDLYSVPPRRTRGNFCQTATPAGFFWLMVLFGLSLTDFPTRDGLPIE
jgi:hypothetical protein